MTPFSTLSAAIQAKLESLAAFAGVLLIQEDAGDVATMIEKEIGRAGMGVLLGVPLFGNDDPLAALVNARIKIELLFMEVPALWRSNATKPHCSDLGQTAAANLQALTVTGFQDLRVLRGEPVVDKETGPMQFYRIEIETMQIFDAST